MAIRIFDATVGQTAGIPVVTTGNGAITNDGLVAYAQMIVSASGSGLTGTATGSGNIVTLTGATITAGTISFSANAQSVIIDTQGFENVSLTVSGFGTATLAVQWSNLAASGFVAGSVTNINTASSGTTITADGQYVGASGGRYLKILTTAFTSGPILVTPTFYAGGGSGGGGGSSSSLVLTTTTTAAPTYVDSTNNAFSTTTKGGLRSTLIDGSGNVIDLTAASIVVGGTAADAALTAAPVTTGGLALSANPTAVTTGDVVNAMYDLVGRQVVAPFGARALCSDTTITITSSTAAATLLAATSAIFHDILSITISNISATATEVQLLNDDGTTVRWDGYVPAGNTIGATFTSPFLQEAVNKAWKFKTVTSVASVKITIQYVNNVA